MDLVADDTFDTGLKGHLSVTHVGDDRDVTGCQTAFACSYGSGREISVSVTSTF
ncbi:hypothetical protein [Loktanella fryxellensis]|uniref:hypothetical protein n=1 Tax=Loktanella fryxellensis TaxID=245187 RepID=UPI0015A6BEF7|nr:hypothetical protein [Loktanella fryxellensis]